MIPSLPSSGGASRPASASGPNVPPPRQPAIRPDRISTEGGAYLQAALARQPAIRPEVVERARTLAADPGYPSPAIMKRIAAQIVGSPDLSEDAA
jgi:hypothetical protein